MGWLPPDVVTPPGLAASGAQLEASGTGTLNLAYVVPDGGVQRVFARYRVPGEAWSVPVAVSTPTAGVLDWDLAVGPDGTAAVVWTEFDGANEVVTARVRPSGGAPWGAPEVLSTTGPNARLPRIAVDAAGRVEVAWIRGTGALWAVESRTRPGASGWDANTYTLGTGTEPSELDVDTAAAHTAVAWVQQISTDQRVHGVVRDGGTGTWPAATAINPSLTSGTDIDVAVASDGNAVVAYLQEQTGPTFTVRSSRRPPAGIFAVPGDAVAAGDANSTDIAVALGDSEAAIAWSRLDGLSRRVDAATAPLGGLFGAPVTLSDPNLSARSPRIDLDGAGGLAAIWRETDGATESVVGRTRAPGSLWGAPSKVAQGIFVGDDPTVVALPAAEAASVWLSPSGGADAAHVAVLDRTAPFPAGLGIPLATKVGDATPFAASFADLWDAAPEAPRWDFGDGARATGANVTHVFGLPGTYAVRLDVEDRALNPFALAQEIRVDPIPPKADTAASTFWGTTTAQLEGVVWPSGRVTGYRFEFGRTTAYGSRTPLQFTPGPVGQFPVKRIVPGLEPGTTYHYRLVATAGSDTNRGGDRTVKTLPPPATFTAPGGGTKVRVAPGGAARIVARCTKACRGSVRLFTLVQPDGKKASKAVEMRQRRKLRIGSRSFSRSSAGTTTLTVQLSAAGRALLAAKGTIRAYIVATVRSGGRTVRTTTNVTLVAAKKRSKRNAEVSRR